MAGARSSSMGLSGSNPRSPFKGDHDPNSIPTAEDSVAGLECAHADTRRNKVTMAAAELDVKPRQEPREVKLEGKPRGMSMQTMDRYQQWRAKRAGTAAVQEAETAPADPVEPARPAANYLQVPALMHDPPTQMYVTKSPAEEFLSQKTRVTIELADGIFTLPAVAVRQSTYCIMVLVPLDDDKSIFVPKPGTELTLAHKDDRLRAYFPGAYIEYPELGVAAMTFIKVQP